MTDHNNPNQDQPAANDDKIGQPLFFDDAVEIPLSEKNIRDALDSMFALGVIVFVLLLIQGWYHVFEVIRHTLVDGWSDHVTSHLILGWSVLAHLIFWDATKVGYAYVFVWYQRKIRGRATYMRREHRG